MYANTASNIEIFKVSCHERIAFGGFDSAASIGPVNLLHMSDESSPLGVGAQIDVCLSIMMVSLAIL